LDIGETLYVTDAGAWRDWLEANHASAAEIWLVYPNKRSGQPRIPYDDAVDEALCFGWIDSIVKSLDGEGAAQRFTPRRPKSPLSEMNKARIRRLHAAGKMTPAELAVAHGVLDEAYAVPADVEAALRLDDEVWRNFEAFPESYKRIRVGWIEGSRNRQDVFERRLAYFIRMTKQGKRFGMEQ